MTRSDYDPSGYPPAPQDQGQGQQPQQAPPPQVYPPQQVTQPSPAQPGQGQQTGAQAGISQAAVYPGLAQQQQAQQAQQQNQNQGQGSGSGDKELPVLIEFVPGLGVRGEQREDVQTGRKYRVIISKEPEEQPAPAPGQAGSDAEYQQFLAWRAQQAAQAGQGQ